MSKKSTVARVSLRIDRKLMKLVRRLSLQFDTSANNVLIDAVRFYSRALTARKEKS